MEHGDHPRPESVALCVDLDGTLLKSDVLYESLLVLLSANPLYLILLPLWLFKGKAALKHEIASRVELDPATLPYDERLVALLKETPVRPRVLCTATNAKFAHSIAEHLGVFDQVLASDDRLNLSGARKASALVDRFGERGFDYAGNETVDLDVWSRARGAWVINGSSSLAQSASEVTQVDRHLPAARGGLKTWIKAIRIHQWLKNLLVFVPLLASHRFLDVGALTSSVVAFLAFGVCASGVYLLNDLLDLPSDRHHPRKRLRPFAAGTLPLLHGLLAAPALTLAGFLLAWLVGPLFALVLAGYYLMTLGYSLRLKRVVMVDVVMLAGLYTIRIIGGAAAIHSGLSFWLLAFSMFIFLSLAMLKRYTELAAMLASGRDKASGRGYEVDDLPLIQSLGAASGYCAVLVFSLYINSPESLELYRHPQVLWLICPMLLYWISRAWIKSHRGLMNDDPVVFAVTDRVSQILIVLCGLLVLGAI
ncbi:4-hydroxybenzoate polyprenyltransferase [Lysobacter niastensis]|uniref:4-hydroxybenzoate polyprenyltransferase n=1 Tax=Lysobacter niastensis TaxID=380629 RepID=A0ABU1WCS6_9GAMM|nr:UbiA family prenyltransferase [Lysobacter niastensis]MDR7135210.1 4-hydroxybenzoate polyprenyltransferase [Lysobacter niastensis]